MLAFYTALFTLAAPLWLRRYSRRRLGMGAARRHADRQFPRPRRTCPARPRRPARPAARGADRRDQPLRLVFPQQSELSPGASPLSGHSLEQSAEGAPDAVAGLRARPRHAVAGGYRRWVVRALRYGPNRTFSYRGLAPISMKSPCFSPARRAPWRLPAGRARRAFYAPAGAADRPDAASPWRGSCAAPRRRARSCNRTICRARA